MAKTDESNTKNEIVRLADIRDDKSWPTDPETVHGFQVSIQQGHALSALLLRRCVQQGRVYYEVIDGFHRTRALLAEGVERHLATTVECSERDANIRRAQASIKKPSEVLHKRAIIALQQCFAEDMAKLLGTAQPLERRITSKGKIEIVTRADPPVDPLDALLMVIEHDIAKGRDEETAKHTWEIAFVKWLIEVSAWFGKDREWLLNEVLGMAILGETHARGALRSKSSKWSLLLRIPDRTMRGLIVSRLRQEPSLSRNELANALSYLELRQYQRVKERTPDQIAAILATHSLATLSSVYMAQSEEMQTLVDAGGNAPEVETNVQAKYESALRERLTKTPLAKPIMPRQWLEDDQKTLQESELARSCALLKRAGQRFVQMVEDHRLLDSKWEYPEAVQALFDVWEVIRPLVHDADFKRSA